MNRNGLLRRIQPFGAAWVGGSETAEHVAVVGI
jgi:hypothetical protein